MFNSPSLRGISVREDGSKFVSFDDNDTSYILGDFDGGNPDIFVQVNQSDQSVKITPLNSVGVSRLTDRWVRALAEKYEGRISTEAERPVHSEEIDLFKKFLAIGLNTYCSLDLSKLFDSGSAMRFPSSIKDITAEGGKLSMVQSHSNEEGPPTRFKMVVRDYEKNPICEHWKRETEETTTGPAKPEQPPLVPAPQPLAPKHATTAAQPFRYQLAFGAAIGGSGDFYRDPVAWGNGIWKDGFSVGLEILYSDAPIQLGPISLGYFFGTTLGYDSNFAQRSFILDVVNVKEVRGQLAEELILTSDAFTLEAQAGLLARFTRSKNQLEIKGGILSQMHVYSDVPPLGYDVTLLSLHGLVGISYTRLIKQWKGVGVGIRGAVDLGLLMDSIHHSPTTPLVEVRSTYKHPLVPYDASTFHYPDFNARGALSVVLFLGGN